MDNQQGNSLRGAIARIALAGLIAASWCTRAQGQDQPSMGGEPAEPSISTSLPSGLADPGGARSALGKRGITYRLNYIGEVLGDVSGGLRRGAQYDGRLELITSVDLEKLMSWRGLKFHAHGFQIHGHSVTSENVGSLAPVSFIEATPATRLYELWLEQSLFNDRLSIRIGQLAADSEFYTSEGGGALIQATFGWPTIAAFGLPDGGPAYPLAAPAVRLMVKATDALTFKAAFFNGEMARPCGSSNPQVCNRYGLEFPLGDPLLMVLEGAMKYELLLPGTLKVGGWKHNGNFDSQRYNDTGAPLAVAGGNPAILHGVFGLYTVVEQMLYKLPGTDNKGVAMFARVIGTQSDRALIGFYFDGGFTFAGMLPGRPDDVIGIGVAYSRIGNGARGYDSDRNENSGIDAPKRSYEAVLEVSYTAQVVSGWSIQPDFQYFWNPGGGGIDPDSDPTGTPRPKSASVVGLRTIIRY